MEKKIYNHLLEKQNKQQKMLALLIDPDKSNEESLSTLIPHAVDAEIDLILVGGSLLTDGDIEETVNTLKKLSSIPVVLFPGSTSQITLKADGILFLSLLSSRNAEMIIGQQVTAAPLLRKTNLEIISTAYLLIESGKQTTASYMSNSNPIPADKEEIAASTALAGSYLGMDLIYMDGGSGAMNHVPAEMIKKVKEYTSNLLVVGGGINTLEKASTIFDAGADLIVVGNAIEKDSNFLKDIGSLKKRYNSR